MPDTMKTTQELIEQIDSYIEKNRKSRPVKQLALLQSARNELQMLSSQLNCEKSRSRKLQLGLVCKILFDFFSE